MSLHAESAKSYYKAGAQAEAAQDYDAAYQDYQKAYSMDPSDLSFRTALYRVRETAAAIHVTKGRKLLEAGDQEAALVELLRAAEIDPGNEAAQQEIAIIKQRDGHMTPMSEAGLPETPGEQAAIDSMAMPPQLKPLSSEPLMTLHMVQDSKVVYQAVGEAAGINVLFDPEYVGRRVQVDLTNVSLLDALRIVGTISGTFWRPVTSNTIFVAADTLNKRHELSEQAVQTFYLTNAWQPNDLNDVNTTLRNMMPNARCFAVLSQNAIVMRGTPDELLLAQKLINDLDKARPEVVIDIAVLEVSKNWERNLGIAWPSSASVALQTSSTSSSTSSTSTSTTSTTPTIYDLAHLKASDFAVTVSAATANFLLTNSTTKILQNPQLRSTDDQKATMKIGSRIPIATGSFQSGAATALVSSLVNTQFTYLDVGVDIDVTPTVHFDNDVTLKIKIAVTSQSGATTISGVTEPIIAQKTSEQVVRLHEGEANIISGIMNQQNQESWSGIPGLSSIPILKYLFGAKDYTKTDDEIVFLMIPHIVREPDMTPVNLRPIDTGTGQTIELRRMVIPAQGGSTGSMQMPVQPVQSAPQSAVGTTPLSGATAQAAGDQALEQMRTAAEGAPSPPTPAAAQPPGEAMSFNLVPPQNIAPGATFQVPVVIAGAKDIASVPLQIQYDPAKLALVNVSNGDFLERGGQAVALVHRDDGPGTIVLNASRPPGATGVNGAGVVCVLSFQAKVAGESTVTILHPSALNSAQQPVAASGTQARVLVK
ncbi:MAG: cohesin domain-containing protein [Terracidiphilus sp.]